MNRNKTFILTLLFFLGICLAHSRAEEPLSWKDCIKEAMKNHPDIIFAVEAVRQSEAAKKITASGLYPQVDATASATRERDRTVSSGNTTKSTQNSFNYGASATQLLFDARKTSDNVRAGAENIKAAQYNYKFTSAAVRFRLRSAFIDLLKSQESLNISSQIYDIRKGNLELITLRYESGIEHKGALLTAQANLSEAEFEIAQSKRSLETAQVELIKEMGRSGFLSMRAQGDFKVTDEQLAKPDFETLAKNHPSLGKLVSQKNAAAFGIKSAQADFFPKLSAQAGASKSDSVWPPKDEQLSAGLSLSLPLLEGGLRFAQVQQAKAVYNQAVANERSSRDGIILTLRQSWAALQDALETVRVQKKFLEASEERSAIAEAQYSLGLIQYDNWTIIEDGLVSAKKAYLNAQAAALQAEAAWVQAKGETLEYAD